MPVATAGFDGRLPARSGIQRRQQKFLFSGHQTGAYWMLERVTDDAWCIHPHKTKPRRSRAVVKPMADYCLRREKARPASPRPSRTNVAGSGTVTAGVKPVSLSNVVTNVSSASAYPPVFANPSKLIRTKIVSPGEVNVIDGKFRSNVPFVVGVFRPTTFEARTSAFWIQVYPWSDVSPPKPQPGLSRSTAVFAPVVKIDDPASNAPPPNAGNPPDTEYVIVPPIVRVAGPVPSQV